MAIGNYRLASEVARPTHSGTAKASTGPARAPDVARMQAVAHNNLVQDQLDWYQGLINIGRSMQMKSAKMDREEERRREAERRRQMAEEASDEDSRDYAVDARW